MKAYPNIFVVARMSWLQVIVMCSENTLHVQGFASPAPYAFQIHIAATYVELYQIASLELILQLQTLLKQ